MASAAGRRSLATLLHRRHHLHPFLSHFIPHSSDDRHRPNPTRYPHPLPFGRRYSTQPDIDLIQDPAHIVTDVVAASDVVTAANVVTAIPGEVAAAAADSAPPVAALQYLIDGVHSFTGLNWWASIALTTVLIRTCTVPILMSQMKATTKLNMMRPELERIKEQMQNSTDPKLIQDSQLQMKALFEKHGITPFTPLKGLFIQGPIFVSFYFAIANMVEKVPSFKSGGTFWFTDLTTPDPQYIFPLLTAATFLATVEFNMQEGMEGNPMAKTMKKFSRLVGVLTVPFTASFPKAIFCYWITSNLFSLMYGSAVKCAPVRKYFNLPDIVPEPSHATQPNMSFFGGFPKAPLLSVKEPEQSEAPLLSVKEPEQSKAPQRKISSSSVVNQRIRSLEKTLKAKSKPKRS